ncbi:aspartic peptidase domain-containing protein, partial [Podospora conica]
MLTDVAYGVKIWIGFPEQAVTLDFDTGSSETWVSPPCTPLSGIPIFEQECREFGQYLPMHSQTGFHVDPKLCPNSWISYGSGAVFVSYYRDTIRVNDPETTYEPPMVLEKPVQFGVANWASNMETGIMGVAYGSGYNQNYTGFIDALYNQNLIAHKDFSVALGSVGKDAGEVVFGGIDTSKFIGKLHALPLATQYTLREDGFYRYWLDVTFIGITTPGSCTTTPLTNDTFSARFLPDTGTTLTYMPEEVFFALLDYFPDAQPQASYGYVVDCDHLNDQGSIDFGFGEFTIHVPIREFVFQVPPMFATDGEDTVCVIGAVPTTDFFILGDTFLRSVVALFRQQEHKVYLAQYMDCGVNIIETHGNMSGMIGDCGHHRSPFEKRGNPQHPDPDYNGIINEKEKEKQDNQAYMTCATYLTGQYTPISTAPWTSEIFQHNLFPLPAMQTVNRDRQGPPDTMVMPTPTMARVTVTAKEKATVTGAKTGRVDRRAVRKTTLPAMEADDETTTECVTATSTEWVAESSASAYPSSSSSSSSSSISLSTEWVYPSSTSSYSDSWPSANSTTTTSTKTKTKTKSKHHHKTTSTCTAEETLSFSGYPSSSISSAMKSYLSAITIPVQSQETIIVKLKTTTYTIIDGVSQTAAATFVPEESSTTSYSGGTFGNSTAWTGYTSSLPTESFISLDTPTTTGWSTIVSGEPDGYITALSWTADSGLSATEPGAPWVTMAVKPRGEESCICMDFGKCLCVGE